MTTTEIILAAAAGLLIPPIFMMLRKRSGCKGAITNVIVTCPECATDIKLNRMRNYKCPKCLEDVVFFDSSTGKPHEKVIFVKCRGCSTSNIEGMKFCYKCNEELPKKGEANESHAEEKIES